MADDKAVEEKVAEICKNKKNSNVIQVHLVKLEEGGEQGIIEVIPILTGVFSFYIKEGVWKTVEEEGRFDDRNKSAHAAVNSWLHDSYKAFKSILLNFISDEKPIIQENALKALLKLLESEYSSSLLLELKNNAVPLKYNFPNQFFISIVKSLVECEKQSIELVQYFKNLLKYDDIRYYTIKNIYSLIQNQNILRNSSHSMAKNIYVILANVTRHDVPDKDSQQLYFQHLLENVGVDVTEVVKSYQHAFSLSWISFFCSKLPSDIHKKILIDLDSKIMPKLTDPKILIDFLTDSYDMGGVISLLSLNGLFVLINQYNLDYPQFYTKLYNLLDVNIFHVKYKSRFFHLLDMFLSSTYLPAYLVAAFVKKLSRMLLFTPVTDQEMLLIFIRNMLIRHPSSRVLIHRKNDKEAAKSFATDPFDYNETEPLKSNAMKSCLWELNSLKSHYSSAVLKSVALFKKEFPKLESDVSEHFDCEFVELFESKMNKVVDNGVPPLNVVKEKEIYEGIDRDMWILE